jgi:hypothetical protein
VDSKEGEQSLSALPMAAEHLDRFSRPEDARSHLLSRYGGRRRLMVSRLGGRAGFLASPPPTACSGVLFGVLPSNRLTCSPGRMLAAGNRRGSIECIRRGVSREMGSLESTPRICRDVPGHVERRGLPHYLPSMTCSSNAGKRRDSRVILTQVAASGDVEPWAAL